VVGCHYFPPGLQLPSQPKSVTALDRYQIIPLGDRDMGVCKQLAQGRYPAVHWAQSRSWDLSITSPAR